jgi:hypothetical protein
MHQGAAQLGHLHRQISRGVGLRGGEQGGGGAHIALHHLGQAEQHLVGVVEGRGAKWVIEEVASPIWHLGEEYDSQERTDTCEWCATAPCTTLHGMLHLPCQPTPHQPWYACSSFSPPTHFSPSTPSTPAPPAPRCSSSSCRPSPHTHSAPLLSHLHHTVHVATVASPALYPRPTCTTLFM